MAERDGVEQPVAVSSFSPSEATRFLGLLISAVMAEARVWLAATAAANGGSRDGAFAGRQRRLEEMVLASFFGLQGVAWNGKES